MKQGKCVCVCVCGGGGGGGGGGGQQTIRTCHVGLHSIASLDSRHMRLLLLTSATKLAPGTCIFVVGPHPLRPPDVIHVINAPSYTTLPLLSIIVNAKCGGTIRLVRVWKEFHSFPGVTGCRATTQCMFPGLPCILFWFASTLIRQKPGINDCE